MEIFGSNLTIVVFIVVFLGLLFLVLKDKVFNRRKRLVKIHKAHNRKPLLSNPIIDSGVIFISKIVKPQGIKDTHSYELPNKKQDEIIDGVRYNGLFDINVIVDFSLEQPVVDVKGDKAFVELINVELNGRFLDITHPQISCNYDLDCEITVKLNQLTSFTNRGQGQVDIEGIDSDSFSFVHNGIENVYLAGRTKKLHLTSKSKADVYAQQLHANVANVDQHGIGDVYCHATEHLVLNINYTGNIYVKDLGVKTVKKIKGKGTVIYRPFEDTILNFIFISIQKILFLKIKD